MGRPSSFQDSIWALREVSFEVHRGEVLGIIGPNGAGKTTLLKILSRITEPTEGRVEIAGRTSSLLEIGSGFHFELTGRENIYLNGAILGMQRPEIERKFDEIVAFAKIEQFLDTPVKHYSSGMYLRLAFAVAAHLEPDILFVDEVLAVGDAAFQKRCLNKMNEAARSGRTVLLVSHNMPAVMALCRRVIWIERGRIIRDGPAWSVVHSYLGGGNSFCGQKTWAPGEGPGNQWFRLLSVTLKDNHGTPTGRINISEEATVEIEYEVIKDGAKAQFSLVLFDAHGTCVFGSLSNKERNFYGRPLKPGRYRTSCSIYGNLLNNGQYSISVLGASDYWSESFQVERAITFEAVDDGILKGDYPGSYGGLIRPRLKWQTIALEDESEDKPENDGSFDR